MPNPIPSNRMYSPFEQRDYTLIIDKSGSMNTRDDFNNQTRWKAAEESVFAIASKVFGFDPDGIDIWLFSNSNQKFSNVNPEKVAQIFRENEPFGGTRMAEVLQKALDDFFMKRDYGRMKAQGEMIMVITDGQPDNQEDVIKVLTNTSHRLRPDDHLSLNFIQVGNDSEATKFLNYLDNELVRRGATRDFVETTKMADIEQNGLNQVLLNVLTKTNHSTSSK